MQIRQIIGLMALLIASSLPAAELGKLHLSTPWSRAMPATSLNGVVFLDIHNVGDQADTLIKAKSPKAKTVELHTHVHENGVMKMREVKDGIAIPAGQMVQLKPGSLHIMLMGLQSPLKAGETFPIELRFSKAGQITLPVTVKAVSDAIPTHSLHH